MGAPASVAPLLSRGRPQWSLSLGQMEDWVDRRALELFPAVAQITSADRSLGLWSGSCQCF